ncbi:MAG: carboxypeptidase regulatory-like domain-containing protein [Blastocatellia bacterium]
MPRIIARFAITFFVLCFCFAPVAFAQNQTTGKITGKVLDFDTKLGIPGAVVTIVNLTKGTQDRKRTNVEGIYFFDFIETGDYRLSVTCDGAPGCDGYERIEQSELPSFPVDLRVNNRPMPPPLSMRKKQATTSVAQPARATPQPATQSASIIRLVNLDDATRSLGFNGRVISSLPLAGFRSFDQLALLAAGVTPPPQTVGNTVGPGIGAGVGTSGQFAVNGLRSRGNNFTVDGSDNNDEDIGVRRQGFTALIPQPIETVQQFNIATLLSRPQYGRNLGGQVDAVSNYGGKDFHGTVFGFFTDRRLKARDAFDLTTQNAPATFDLKRCPNGAQFCDGGTPITLTSFPNGVQTTAAIRRANPVGGEDPFTRGQFGGVISGPLSRKQTFFLASYERRLLNASRESNFAVPTVAERGLFNSGDRGLTVKVNNRDVSAFPVSAKGDSFFSLFPFANNPRGPYGDNTYTQVLPADARGHIGSFRVDQSFQLFKRQQTFAARYNTTDDNTTLPVTGEALFSTMRAMVRTQNLAFTFSGSLSERTSQTLRFSYGRTRLNFAEVRAPFSDFLLPSKLKSGGKNIPFLLNSRLYANAAFPGALPGYVQFGGDDAEGDLALGTGTGPVGQVIVSGYSPLGVDVYNFPQSRADNTFQIAETVSHSFLKHTIQGGADFRRVQINSALDRNFRPVALFSGALDVSQRFGINNVFLPNTNGFFRGADFAAAGAATGFLQTQAFVPDSTIGLRIWQGNIFAEDQFDLAPNFKVTVGIRYELNSVPREVNNRIENTFTSQAARDFVAAEKSQFGVSGFENFIAGRTTIFRPDRNNVAPHLAFAWAPSRDGKTAIRGGYGIYYDQIPGAVISQSRSVFPSFLTINLAGVRDQRTPTTLIPFNPSRLTVGNTLNTVNTANAQLGSNATQILLNLTRLANQGNANSGRENFPGGPGFVLPAADLATPYSQQWSLTFEREVKTGLLTSLAYVGTRGSHLLRFATPNLGVNAVPVITGGQVPGSEVNLTGFLVSPGTGVAQGSVFRRPYPLLGSITSIESDANSTYHSLQAEASMRLSPAFKFTSAYTWSHAIDEVSDLFDLAGARTLPQNSLNRAADRGDANFDVRHRFAESFVWDLPWLQRNKAIGGWQLAGIVTLQTGQPFTVTSSVDVNLDGNLTDRLNSSSGLSAVNNGSLRYQFPTTVEGQRALIAAAGVDGAVGRNTFRAPGVANVDLAANKFFHFTETQSFEFRTEVFNLFNRTHFGIPAHQLFAPGLGRSVNTTVPARTVQFALRYKF